MTYALPVVSWFMFFVFAVLIMTDRIEVTTFKVVILMLFFVIGFFSSMLLRVPRK